jgi:hypothetical protein
MCVSVSLISGLLYPSFFSLSATLIFIHFGEVQLFFSPFFFLFVHIIDRWIVVIRDVAD